MLQALFGAPVIAGLLGFLLAWWFYIRSPETPKKLAASLSAPYKLLLGKYFIDELYAAVIVRPLVWISDKVLWHVVDEGAIDGTVNGVASRLARIRRPAALREFRKHAQLRHVDHGGRGGLHFPAALDGGLTCSKPIC
jgi:NADH:ubiquinone oxidoreductase subunit 5 (subunit L)/multisubunit Na+/H+ antiporter MnhA subunit